MEEKEFAKRRLNRQLFVGGAEPLNAFNATGSVLQSTECPIPITPEMKRGEEYEPQCMEIDWGMGLRSADTCMHFRGIDHDKNGLFVYCSFAKKAENV